MRNKILNRCRICFSKKLVNYLNLGKQPFSNSFLNYKNIKREKKFPLMVVLCQSCGLSQLSIIPNTKFIFSKYDYLSSSSKALSNHYKKLVEKLVKSYVISPVDTVLDIGCNDGSLLDYFRAQGAMTIGVEPTGAFLDAEAKGHITYNNFLSEKLADAIVDTHGKPDFITFTNVFAHKGDLQEVLLPLNYDGCSFFNGKLSILFVHGNTLYDRCCTWN